MNALLSSLERMDRTLAVLWEAEGNRLQRAWVADEGPPLAARASGKMNDPREQLLAEPSVQRLMEAAHKDGGFELSVCAAHDYLNMEVVG